MPDVTDLTRKADFDTKLSNISNRVTPNETNNQGQKKINDHIASDTNLVNKLLREISQVSTKDTSFLLEMYYSINVDSQFF